MATKNPIEYIITNDPKGYIAKREITNADPRFLVKGSKNIIINDGDKWSSRPGYILDGQANTVKKGIDSSYDFISKQGLRVVRSHQGATANTGKLQVRTEYTSGTPIWADLLTGLTYTEFNYTTWWYDTEVTRCLIFVDGTSSIRMWGGGIAYVASNTSSTITKSGTKTWAEEGFFISHSGRKVTINGVEYTYTGGENTTTLTGLTGLPAITVGTPVFQSVVTVTSLTGVSTTITPNVVATKDNHIFYGSTNTSVVWFSNVTSYTDCSFTTPLRKAGEGGKIVLDNNTVGFAQDENAIYIYAGRDDRYKITLVIQNAVLADSVTNGLTETIVIDKKIAAGQAAISQSAIIQTKNGLMYFTNEKTLTWFTSIENIFTPQAVPISDPIKDDFDSYDLTGVSGIFWGNAIWVAIPRESLVYIYDFDKSLWQTPQTIPISRFSIIDNVLYGHSNSANETYKLNTGTDDNGVIIDYVAAFAYNNYGDRATLKQFDSYFVEAYLAKGTILKARHNYDYQGSKGVLDSELDSADQDLLFAQTSDTSLGKDNLGKNPLGSSIVSISNLNKYRIFWDLQLNDFFEYQIVFSCDSENGQFELIAHGPNVRGSTSLATDLHK